MKIVGDFIFDPSLVLYLPLYKLDGVSFMSKDAYGHLCTVTGALWTPQGRDFDGVDDKVTIPDHASLDITTALTLMAWVYHDASANEVFLAKWDATDESYSLLEGGNKKLYFRISVGDEGKAVECDTDLATTTWLFLAGVYNKTDLRGYLNGSLDCTPVAETGDIDSTAANIYAGWGISDTFAWGGRIGEVWVHNRALTPQEIQNIYLASKWRYQ